MKTKTRGNYWITRLIMTTVLVLVLLQLPKLTAKAANPTEGSCGDNVTWNYNSGTATLTITGSGDMNDWFLYNDETAPWYCYKDYIKKATISDGVTSIGAGSFYKCSNIEEVKIGKNVKSIGSTAFRDCKSLTGINLPDNLEIIGEQAFWECSLTSINLPSKLTTIGNNAFYSCLFEDVKIPNSVTSIGENVFSDCKNLKSFTWPNRITKISGFSGCSSLDNVKIPSNVTSIGGFQNCSSLKNITIPSSVTSIESGAFLNCTSLKTVVIPESVNTLGHSAFWGCTNLTDIAIPSGVKKLDYRTFQNCVSLTNIKIPDSVTSIAWWTFTNCASLKSITIPAGVNTLVSTGLGYYDLDGKSVKIPGFTIYGVAGTAAQYYAKDNGFNFVEIKTAIEETEDKRLDSSSEIKKESIGDIVKDEKTGITYVITSVDDSNLTVACVSGNDKNATALTISATLEINGKTYKVTEIKDKAFKNNKKLRKASLSKNIEKIGKEAFSGCKSLKNVTIKSTGLTKKSVGKNAFKGINAKAKIKVPKKKVKDYTTIFKARGLKGKNQKVTK